MMKQQAQLTQIHKNMPVYNNAGQIFGNVSYVYTGTPAQSKDLNNPSLADVVNQLPQGYPSEVNEVLLQEGFIKVETGLRSDTRYVLPTHIYEVRSGELHLSHDPLILP